MSDFNEVVKRVTTDHSFRTDMLKDLNGTLKVHNYSCTPAELAELAQLDQSKLDQLDESLMEQVVGGAGIAPINSPTLGGLPQFQGALEALNKQNFFKGFRR